MTNDGENNDIVTVGEKGTQLSFHQLQDIYNALTGKTESIRHFVSKPYILSFEDLEQLHHRIYQCCDSYGAKIRNVAISVFTNDGQKELFSSFDRFRMYNKSQSSPVENVNIEYNILIIPAGSDTPRKYRIVIDLPSRIGIWERKPELALGVFSLRNFWSKVPARVRIEYVDYAAAKHFLTQIIEWFDSLEYSREWGWLRGLQSISHWFRDVFPAVTVIFTLLVFYLLAGEILSDQIDAPSEVQFYCLIAVFSVSAWLAGKMIGRSSEWAVDRVQPISCVKLNRGDEKCLQKRRSSNFISSAIGAVSFFGLFLLNYLINIIAAISVEKWF